MIKLGHSKEIGSIDFTEGGRDVYRKHDPPGEHRPVGDAVQFERQGYFCPDPTSRSDALVFNRTIELRDTWAKLQVGG